MDDKSGDPQSWRNWSPVSPYLQKDTRYDLGQGMSLKVVELIEEKANEAKQFALEAERLSSLAQKASQEALTAIERKDPDVVKEKVKEAETYASQAKEVEEKCKLAYEACKKAREDARNEAENVAMPQSAATSQKQAE